MAIAYVNGEWLAPEDAQVSIFDRGFLFGDAVYEVMAVYDSRIFRIEDHVIRLERSLEALGLEPGLSQAAWQALFEEAVQRGHETDALLYVQVTRGAAQPRSHAYPDNPKPTVVMTVTPSADIDRGNPAPLKVVTKSDYRWQRADVKVTSLVANGILKNEALAEGYDDAILVRDGEITEATAANVFIVKNNAVITPPKSNHLLHGVTRDCVIEIAHDLGFPVREAPVLVRDLLGADEIWFTSTGNELRPIVEVNGVTVGNGSTGAAFTAVCERFQAAKRSI